MIYELRIYRCVPGRHPALLSRFENETLRIWEKHGICQAGFWTTLIGKSSQEITYAKGRFQQGIVFAAAASGRDAVYYHFWTAGAPPSHVLPRADVVGLPPKADLPCPRSLVDAS